MSAGNTPESTTEVPTETSEVNSGISVSTLAQVIGIFIFAGIGIGATAGITITQLGSGSAILGGILTLVVLTIVFLLGPVIGLIAGLRVGSENGATTTSYLVSFLGSTAGYFAMIIVVILAMSVAMIEGGEEVQSLILPHKQRWKATHLGVCRLGSILFQSSRWHSRPD
jgi:hypothetical protein